MTPAPSDFVTTCNRRGIRLQVVGDKIRATGTPPPNPEAFAAYLRAHKPALLELLAGRPTPTPAEAPVTGWKRNAPAGGSARPVQAPHPGLGTDVPRQAPQAGVCEDPLPDFALLDKRQPWPACDGLTAIGAKRYAARLVVSMVARGRTRAQCAYVLEGTGLDLDDVLREALVRQERYRAEASGPVQLAMGEV